MTTEVRGTHGWLKRLTYAAAATFALAAGTPLMTAASPAAITPAPARAASHASTPGLSAVRSAVVLLAQAGGGGAGDPTAGTDPSGKMESALQKVVGIFTGGPAKLLIVLAIVGTCITLLQRPDHHELIGNMTKVILIGVIIIFAQSMVNFMFAAAP